MYTTNRFLLIGFVNSLSLSHSEPNIATAFGRRSRRKVIAEQRTASSRLFMILFVLDWYEYAYVRFRLAHDQYYSWSQFFLLCWSWSLETLQFLLLEKAFNLSWMAVWLFSWFWFAIISWSLSACEGLVCWWARA